jgi:pimeloyl-ACP methyl ester carboxylesterase
MYFRDQRHQAAFRAFLDGHAIPVRTLQAVSATDGGFPFRERDLRRLRVPTLVASGRYDLFCPPGPARTVAEAIPGARHAVFEESGHFPWLEEPAAFFATIDRFLARSTVMPTG